MESVADNMLFNPETTYKHAFKTDELSTNTPKSAPKTSKVPKAEKPERDYSFAPDFSPNYVETMTKWHRSLAPFNLYIRPNPVRCDPRIKQKHYEKLGDPKREEAQKTRPRLVMTPAASLDDIDDPEIRSFVVGNMYESTQSSSLRPMAERAFPVDKNVKAPLGDTYSRTKPVDLPKRRQPYVCPEWRMESIFWDRRKLRGHVDPTAEFWQHRIKELEKK